MESDLVEKLAGLNIEEKSNLFEKKDLESVAKLLREGHFKKIALMIGAGVSVNAGIPDFRSKGGLYDTLREMGYPQPEVVFDIRLFHKKPEVFYEVAGMLDTTSATPTLTHYFIKLLEEKNLLLKCFTQNIDSLELKAGLSKNKLMQAHGIDGFLKF